VSAFTLKVKNQQYYLELLLETAHPCYVDHSIPIDAIGWLYVARGMYKLKDYQSVIEAVGHCHRNEKTSKEAQHLLVMKTPTPPPPFPYRTSSLPFQCIVMQTPCLPSFFDRLSVFFTLAKHHRQHKHFTNP
jgi:hypothetical protein